MPEKKPAQQSFNAQRQRGENPDYNRNDFSSGIFSNGAKSPSNLIRVPQISLPKGGGAIKSIDEKFQVNGANCTSSFSIPVPLSLSRNNFMLSLALSYNSGAGNGPFGIGWSLKALSIQRKTYKKLPEYQDASDSDTFIFLGEDLVPVFIKDNVGNWVKHTMSEGGQVITRYRPCIKGSFARIEKIEEDNNVYWKVRTKENIDMYLEKTNPLNFIVLMREKNTK